jgi:hypothetical protein
MARTTISAAGALSLLLVGPWGTARAEEPVHIGAGPEVHGLFDKTVCFTHNARDWRCDWLFPDVAASVYQGARVSEVSQSAAESEPARPTASRPARGPAPPAARPKTSSSHGPLSINLCFWDPSPASPCRIELPGSPALSGGRAAGPSS